METDHRRVCQGLYRHSDLMTNLDAWRGFYENVVIDFVAQAVAKRRMKAAVVHESRVLRPSRADGYWPEVYAPAVPKGRPSVSYPRTEGG